MHHLLFFVTFIVLLNIICLKASSLTNQVNGNESSEVPSLLRTSTLGKGEVISTYVGRTLSEANWLQAVKIVNDGINEILREKALKLSFQVVNDSPKFAVEPITGSNARVDETRLQQSVALITAINCKISEIIQTATSNPAMNAGMNGFGGILPILISFRNPKLFELMMETPSPVLNVLEKDNSGSSSIYYALEDKEFQLAQMMLGRPEVTQEALKMGNDFDKIYQKAIKDGLLV